MLTSRWITRWISCVHDFFKNHQLNDIQMIRFQSWDIPNTDIKVCYQFLHFKNCVPLIPPFISKSKSCAHASSKTSMLQTTLLYYFQCRLYESYIHCLKYLFLGVMRTGSNQSQKQLKLNIEFQAWLCSDVVHVQTCFKLLSSTA